MLPALRQGRTEKIGKEPFLTELDTTSFHQCPFNVRMWASITSFWSRCYYVLQARSTSSSTNRLPIRSAFFYLSSCMVASPTRFRLQPGRGWMGNECVKINKHSLAFGREMVHLLKVCYYAPSWTIRITSKVKYEQKLWNNVKNKMGYTGGYCSIYTVYSSNKKYNRKGC